MFIAECYSLFFHFSCLLQIYKNTILYWILHIDFVVSDYKFINSKLIYRFGGDFQHKQAYHLWIRIESSFQYYSPYIFFYLIALDKISYMIWTKSRSGNREHVSIIFDLREKFLFIAPLWFLLMTLFLVLNVFNHKWPWFLSNFSASIEVIIWFFFIFLLMWAKYVTHLKVLNQLWMIGINLTGSWYGIIFIYCLIFLKKSVFE